MYTRATLRVLIKQAKQLGFTDDAEHWQAKLDDLVARGVDYG